MRSVCNVRHPVKVYFRRMFWTAVFSWTVPRRTSSSGFRSIRHQLHVIRLCHSSHRRNLTLEMKRGAEGVTDIERISKVAKIDASQPEAGSSNSPAGKSVQQADQKQKKKKSRGRGRQRQEPAEGEESTEPKTPRLPKRQCALLIGFCGTGYSGMQLYGPRFLYRRMTLLTL